MHTELLQLCGAGLLCMEPALFVMPHPKAPIISFLCQAHRDTLEAAAKAASFPFESLHIRPIAEAAAVSLLARELWEKQQAGNLAAVFLKRGRRR